MKQGLQNEFLTVHMQHRIASHVNASGFSVSVGFLLRISSSSSTAARAAVVVVTLAQKQVHFRQLSLAEKLSRQHRLHHDHE